MVVEAFQPLRFSCTQNPRFPPVVPLDCWVVLRDYLILTNDFRLKSWLGQLKTARKLSKKKKNVCLSCGIRVRTGNDLLPFWLPFRSIQLLCRVNSKALSARAGMPVGHYQLFRFSLAFEAVLPDNLIVSATPSHFVHWNGLWEQCLSDGHSRSCGQGLRSAQASVLRTRQTKKTCSSLVEQDFWYSEEGY